MLHRSHRFRRPRAAVSLSKRQRRAVVLFALSGLCFLTFLNFNQNLIPVMTEIAINEANELVTTSINEAITARLLDGSLSYAELVQLEKDTSGNITALTTDIAQINALQALITNEVLANVSGLSDSTMRIPIGNIMGGPLLSGRGPGIRFRVLTLGTPSASFSNEFHSAGINQTKHQIMLELSVQVSILLPGHQTQETITTQMLVAETIIVGDVPNTFGTFHMPIPRS